MPRSACTPESTASSKLRLTRAASSAFPSRLFWFPGAELFWFSAQGGFRRRSAHASAARLRWFFRSSSARRFFCLRTRFSTFSGAGDSKRREPRSATKRPHMASTHTIQTPLATVRLMAVRKPPTTR